MILPPLEIMKVLGVDCGNKLKITFRISIGFPFIRSLLKTLPTVVAVVVVTVVFVVVFVAVVGVVTDCNTIMVMVAI